MDEEDELEVDYLHEDNIDELEETPLEDILDDFNLPISQED